jgi:hypothetical protein
MSPSFFYAFTARLKSCPDTKHEFFRSLGSRFSAFGGVAVSVLGGLIPYLGIAYFSVQIFCIEARLVENFARGGWGCLWVTHNESEPTIGPWPSKGAEGGILKPS